MSLKIFRAWLAQQFCKHECNSGDLVRVTSERVECPCRKCGLMLTADCGLHLNATMFWGHKKKDPEEKI